MPSGAITYRREIKIILLIGFRNLENRFVMVKRGKSNKKDVLKNTRKNPSVKFHCKMQEKILS